MFFGLSGMDNLKRFHLSHPCLQICSQYPALSTDCKSQIFLVKKQNIFMRLKLLTQTINSDFLIPCNFSYRYFFYFESLSV